MTGPIDNGCAAFPGPAFSENGYPSGHDMGMTLRDWFAGQALNGFAAAMRGSGISMEELAAASFAVADAMIAARKGGAA